MWCRFDGNEWLCNICCVMLNYYDLSLLQVGLKSFAISVDYRDYMGSSLETRLLVDRFDTWTLIIWSVLWHSLSRTRINLRILLAWPSKRWSTHINSLVGVTPWGKIPTIGMPGKGPTCLLTIFHLTSGWPPLFLYFCAPQWSGLGVLSSCPPASATTWSCSQPGPRWTSHCAPTLKRGHMLTSSPCLST